MASPLSSDNSPVPDTLCHRRGWLYACLIAALFFLTAAPTLRWQQFSSGSENLVVATVLEMKRATPSFESWWTPTLKGNPRLAKPPLTAWIAAAAVSPATVAATDSADPATRRQAYNTLAWQIRWPALLSSTLALLAAFEFARLLFGSATGLLTMTMAATSLLLLRFGHYATTDVQLLLWVSVTNALILHAFLRHRPRLLVVAGLTLGLAFMSKGPVAFIQSILPAALALAWLARTRTNLAAPPLGEPSTSPPNSPELSPPPLREVLGRRYLIPTFFGLLLFCVVGLPWYAHQLLTNGIAKTATKWAQEVTREGATTLERDAIYNYLALVPLMAPWFVFLVAGLIAPVRERKSPAGRALVATLLFLVVPVVIMSLFKDKPARYLLPVLPPAAALCGAALFWMYRPTANRIDITTRRIGLAMPWVGALLITAVGATALPGRIDATLTPVDGRPWLSPSIAAGALMVLLALAIAGLILSRRHRFGAFAAAACAMVLAGNLGLYTYARLPAGQTGFRNAAEILRTHYPGRPVHTPFKRQDPLPHELNIYLNQVVPEVAELSDIAAPDAVLVLLQKERFGPPPIPPGWKKEHTLSAEKRVLVICVRDEQGREQGPGQDNATPATRAAGGS